MMTESCRSNSEKHAPSDDVEMPSQLLTRFVEQRDQAAFEQLVRWYGPLVLGVCRRIVGDYHDAEDLFQATFLMLARQAHTITCREGITNWLHRVAFHNALKFKSAKALRKQRETPMDPCHDPAVVTDETWLEVMPILDQELDQLPAQYRLPLLLCDLGGSTQKEAARHLGCPEGTISSRLARGRELLAQRLTRQGVFVTSATLIVLFSQNTASAAVPASLLTATIAAASTVSVAPTTVAGTVYAKLLGLADRVRAIAFWKTVIASASGFAILTAGLSMNGQRAGLPPAKAVAGNAVGGAQNNENLPTEDLPTVEEIQKVIADSLSQLDFIQVEYVYQSHRLVELDRLKSVLPNRSFLPYHRETTSFSFKTRKRKSYTVDLGGIGLIDADLPPAADQNTRAGRQKPSSQNQESSNENGPAAVVTKLPLILQPKPPSTRSFNGSEFLALTGNTATIERATKSMRARFSTCNYLTLSASIYIADPTAIQSADLDAERDAEGRMLPKALSRTAFAVSAENLEGERFIKLDGEIQVGPPGNSSPKLRDMMWLDPARGYCLKRRDLSTSSGQVLLSVVNRNPKEVLPGLWLPLDSAYYESAPPTTAESTLIEPLIRTDLHVIAVDTNPIPDQAFEPIVPAGVTITEVSQDPWNQRFNQIPQTSTRTTNLAERHTGHRSYATWVFLVINGAVLITFGAYFLIRRRK